MIPAWRATTASRDDPPETTDVHQQRPYDDRNPESEGDRCQPGGDQGGHEQRRRGRGPDEDRGDDREQRRRLTRARQAERPRARKPFIIFTISEANDEREA